QIDLLKSVPWRIGNDVVGQRLEGNDEPRVQRGVCGIFVPSVSAGINGFQSYARRAIRQCAQQGITSTPKINLLYPRRNGLADQIRCRGLECHEQPESPSQGIRAGRVTRSPRSKIGRASCRERVWILVVAVAVKI